MDVHLLSVLRTEAVKAQEEISNDAVLAADITDQLTATVTWSTLAATATTPSPVQSWEASLVSLGSTVTGGAVAAVAVLTILIVSVAAILRHPRQQPPPAFATSVFTDDEGDDDKIYDVENGHVNNRRPTEEKERFRTCPSVSEVTLDKAELSSFLLPWAHSLSDAGSSSFDCSRDFSLKWEVSRNSSSSRRSGRSYSVRDITTSLTYVMELDSDVQYSSSGSGPCSSNSSSCSSSSSSSSSDGGCGMDPDLVGEPCICRTSLLASVTPLDVIPEEPEEASPLLSARLRSFLDACSVPGSPGSERQVVDHSDSEASLGAKSLTDRKGGTEKDEASRSLPAFDTCSEGGERLSVLDTAFSEDSRPSSALYQTCTEHASRASLRHSSEFQTATPGGQASAKPAMEDRSPGDGRSPTQEPPRWYRSAAAAPQGRLSPISQSNGSQSPRSLSSTPNPKSLSSSPRTSPERVSSATTPRSSSFSAQNFPGKDEIECSRTSGEVSSGCFDVSYVTFLTLPASTEHEDDDSEDSDDKGLQSVYDCFDLSSRLAVSRAESVQCLDNGRGLQLGSSTRLSAPSWAESSESLEDRSSSDESTQTPPLKPPRKARSLLSAKFSNWSRSSSGRS